MWPPTSPNGAACRPRLLSAERMVAVGTIAASVAHEINNPLSYVIACLELLMRDSHPVTELASCSAPATPTTPT